MARLRFAVLELASRLAGNHVLDELPDVRGGKVLDGPLPDQGDYVAVDASFVGIEGRGPFGASAPGHDQALFVPSPGIPGKVPSIVMAPTGELLIFRRIRTLHDLCEKKLAPDVAASSAGQDNRIGLR
jgi:hypothetical protein